MRPTMTRLCTPLAIKQVSERCRDFQVLAQNQSCRCGSTAPYHIKDPYDSTLIYTMSSTDSATSHSAQSLQHHLRFLPQTPPRAHLSRLTI